MTPRVILRLALCMVAALASHIARSNDAGKMNVVFVLSDNQSFYEMSCHGHAQIKTPYIDALARESVEFTHFYAPPFCSPSRSVILTGRYTFDCRIYPREANKAVEADHAKLVIGDVVAETSIESGATHAKFELNLKAGDYDLETLLSREGKKPRGALFVYVSRD